MCFFKNHPPTNIRVSDKIITYRTHKKLKIFCCGKRWTFPLAEKKNSAQRKERQHMNTDELKKRLPEYLEQIGEPLNKNFVCLNPNHNDHNPSMAYDSKHERVKCFGCGASWDLFDLIAVEELGASVSDDGKPKYNFSVAKQTAAKILGVTLTGQKPQNTPLNQNKGISEQFKTKKGVIDRKQSKTAQKGLEEQITTNEQNRKIIERSQEILNREWIDNLSESDKKLFEPLYEQGVQYLKKRGISPQTASQWKIGYLGSWTSPTAIAHGLKPEKANKTPRLIIPTGKNSYIARDTRDDIPQEQQKYRKMKEGSAQFFNGKALKLGSTPVFVVEGEIDALSILEAGCPAVALGSVALVSKLAQQVKKIKESQKNYHPNLLLALDNDKSGQLAQQKLIAMLQKLNVEYHPVQIARGYKDANEALVNNREQFIEDVQSTYQHPDNRLQNWIDYFNGGRQKAIKTGFKGIDKAMDGGLYEGLYGLGAISSLGKTTLALQIADNIAYDGETPVMYFALEMGWQEMTSKSISRLTAINEARKTGEINGDLAQTTRSLQQGLWKQRYNKAQQQNLQDAISEYATYADNIIYRDGQQHRPSAQDVANMVDSYIARTGKKPVVIVDYLQILAPVDPRATDKSAVTTSATLLKQIATRHHIPVIMISSFNRSTYQSPASMESFKESGDIEYSADVLLGLQLKGVGTDKFDVNEAKREVPRDIELVVLKNRNGQTGQTLSLDYDPRFNLFAERDYQAPKAKPTSYQIDDMNRLIKRG